MNEKNDLPAAMKRLYHVLLVLLCTAVPHGVQAGPFRFAWLSDTHVGSPTGEEDLRMSVRDINTLPDVAFVLLSGDITELGWDAELKTAKGILDSLVVPYHIIPGNHDTKWSESGCTSFSRIFGADRFVFDYGTYTFVGLHEGPIMKMGDGHFAPEDLRWMDSVLAALPDPRRPLFLVTHYPLDDGIDNWQEMTQRLRRFNTQAVLCGHGHANRAMMFDGIPGIMGRSNLRAKQEIGGYTIVDVRHDSLYVAERTPGNATRAPWCVLHAGASPTAPVSQRSVLPQGGSAWVHNAGWTIASSPAVSEGNIIVGNGSGSIGCFGSTDGHRMWEFHTGATVYSTPGAFRGRVVVGSSDGSIYCLSTKDGKELWRVRTGAPVVSAPAICNGVVYVGGGDSVFRALSLDDGHALWEFPGVGAFVETRPLVYDGKIIFGSWDGNLYALDSASGTLAWQWSNGNTWRALAPAACWPVGVHGRVFIVAPDRYMTALDASTGTQVWRSNAFRVRESIGVSADGSRVYAKTMNDSVLAVSSAANAPDVLWVTNCGFGYDIDPSMIVERDGAIFFGTKNGQVFSLDGLTGSVRWKRTIGCTVVNTPVVIGRDSIVVTDLDGTIRLLCGAESSQSKRN